MSPLPQLSQEKLITLTKLTGGAALLVVVALFISTASGGQSQTAASFYAFPSGASLSIDANPTSLYAGSSSYVNWAAARPTPGSCSISLSPAYTPARQPMDFYDTGKSIPQYLAYTQVTQVGNTLYIFGGYNGSAIRNIYSAPVSNPTTWTDTGKLIPAAIYGGTTAVVGNSVYLYGGSSNGNPGTTIYAASTTDPTTWRVMGRTLPVGIVMSNGIVTDGTSLYMIGSSYSVGEILTASVSDPNKWTDTGKSLPQHITDATLVTVGSTAYLYGGVTDGAGYSTHTYSADISDFTTWTDTGKTVDPNTTWMWGAQAVTIGDTIYFLGANGGSGYHYSTASIYDPATVVANTIASFPALGAYTFDYQMSYVVNGTDVYMIGGGTGREIYSNVVNNPTSFEDISQENNRWIGDNIMSQPVVIGDNIWMFGGYSGSYTNRIYSASTTDPSTWTIYTSGKVLPVGTGLAQTVVDGDNILLLGGWTGSGISNKILAASTSNPSKWIDTGKVLPTTGIYYVNGVVTIGDNMFLLGGNTSTGATSTILAASTSNPTKWIQTGKSLPAPLYEAQVAVIGQNIYIFGGLTTGFTATTSIFAASTTNPTRWIYDSGKFLPYGVSFGNIAVTGGNVYIYGGINNAGNYINTIIAASTTSPTKWINTGKTLPANINRAFPIQLGNSLYIFGGWNGSNVDDAIYVAPATSSAPFFSYANPSWLSDGSMNGADTWPAIAQTTTYTLSCKDYTGANGSVQQVIAAAPQPLLNLNPVTVNGTTTVPWSAQYANSCTLSGTGITTQNQTCVSNYCSGMAQGKTGAATASYTLTCTTPVSNRTKSVTSAGNGWFYAVIKSLPSFGLGDWQSAATDLSNRVLRGWPAPLGCSYPPVDKSESWCAYNGYSTTYGVLSAYENANPYNGSTIFLTGKDNAEGRYSTSGWTSNWLSSFTTRMGPSTVLVPHDSAATLEWACQETQRDFFEDNCGLFGLNHCTSTYFGEGNTNGFLNLFNVSSTTNFATTSTQGYMTVTAPALNVSKTYYLQCKRTSNNKLSPVMSITLKGSNNPPPAPPTATISIDSATQTKLDTQGYIVVGDTAQITATYAADTAGGDSLAATAIYNDSQTSVPCANIVPFNAQCDQQPDAQKVYTFTPSTAGTYNFYSALNTLDYDNGIPMGTYASTQIIVVVPTAEVVVASSTTDLPETNTAPLNFNISLNYINPTDLPIDFSMAGTATRNLDYTLSGNGIVGANGTTVVIPAGAGSVDVSITPLTDLLYEGDETAKFILSPSSLYTVGYLSSSTITIKDRENPTSLPPGPGVVGGGGDSNGSFTSCTGAASASCNLGVTPVRVRKGGTVTVSWNVTGLISGANGNSGDICTVASSPNIVSAGFPPAFTIDGSNNWIGSVSGIPINQQTSITLKCIAPNGTTSKSTSKTITVIPSFQEI